MKNLHLLDTLPNGWLGLANDLKQELAEFSKKYNHNKFQLNDVKEKFGALVIYFSDYGSDETYEHLEKIIDKYEDLSRTTCVVCGEQGTKKNAYQFPLCDKHKATMER